MNHLIQKHRSCNPSPLVFIFAYAFVALLAGCSTPARFEAMVPPTIETAKRHPHSVRVVVTGGQEDPAIGRPHITDAAFTQALVESITKSQVFLKVIQDQTAKADYLLTVTLFSLDKLVFGGTVTMEAGWTLRRADNGAVIWQEAIVSESPGNVIVGTEAAARNNIAQGLGKVSKLNL